MPYTCGDLLILNDGLFFCYSVYNINTDILVLYEQNKNSNFLSLDTKIAIFISRITLEDSQYEMLISGQKCHVFITKMNIYDCFKKVT